MRSLIILSISLFASASFAILKPDGALLASVCGDNLKSAPKPSSQQAQVKGFPTSACIYDISGMGASSDLAMFNNKLIFGIQKDGAMNYYVGLGFYNIAVSAMVGTETVITAYPMVTGAPQKGYAIAEDVDLVSMPIQVIYNTIKNPNTLEGQQMNVKLDQPIFHLQKSN